MNLGKNIDWNDEKNNLLIQERGVGFEDVIVAIENNRLLGVVNGKAPKYKHQQILVVSIDGYTYAVPFVETQEQIFLKTLYPSRELHKKYHQGVK